MSEKKRLLGGTALLGGTVENERLQRGTVPPSPQAGSGLEKERLERNTVPPTKSTGKILEMKKRLLGGTVAEERSQRGTVPPCPQAGRELRIEIRKSSADSPTMSTGKRYKEKKLLGGTVKPNHTLCKLPETSR